MKPMPIFDQHTTTQAAKADEKAMERIGKIVGK